MGKLILVADDSKDMLLLLERMLTEQGYLVTTVSDGVAATLKTKEIKPDLVILDLQMPGAYGTTVYDNLRLEPETKTLPVLFISGKIDEDAFRTRIAKDPHNAFLAKPFDLKVLVATVKRLLGENV